MTAQSQKIVLVGDQAVGKTSLVTRWTESLFDGDQLPTIGCAHVTREVTIGSVRHIVQLWDTAGQEVYQSMAPIYVRGAAGAMVVFDLTSRRTFENVTKWMKFLDNPMVQIVLVGNKCDLVEDRQVSIDEAMVTADRLHCHFACTSAQTGFGVDDAFIAVVKLAAEARSQTSRSSIVCDLADKRPARGCC